MPALSDKRKQASNRSRPLRALAAKLLAWLGLAFLSGAVWAQPAAESPARGEARELLAKAKEQIEQEKYENARELLEEADRAAPDQPEIRHNLGYTLFRLGRLEEAESHLKWVVHHAPPAHYSRYFLGRIAVQKDDPQAAIEWLEPAAASGEQIHDTQAQLGKAYLLAGRLEQARAALESALQQTPWDDSVHYLLGRAYQRLGLREQAEQEFRASQRLKKTDFQAVQRIREISQRLGEQQRTEPLALRDELLRDEQLDPGALLALGLVFANAGLPAEALPAFERAAARDPSFFQAHYNAGLTLLKLKQPGRAEERLQRAAELNPNAFEANSALGLARIMLGRYAEAAAPLEAARRLGPDNAKVAGLLGLSYVRAGRAEDAVNLLRPFVDAAPPNPRFHFLLIEALQQAGRHDEALRRAEEAVRNFPQAPQGYLAQAQELMRLGRYQQAGPLFEKVLELSPGYAPALIGLGEVRQKDGDYEAALDLYRRALQRDRRSEEAWLGVGKNLALLERYDEAREALEAAVRERPETPSLRFELARVYSRLGEQEKAAEQSRIFRRLQSENPNSGGMATGRGTPPQ